MNFVEKFAERKWGVFNHYLWAGVCQEGDPRNSEVGAIAWNDAVEMFDVERLAWSLHKMNAGYYFITLMQGTAHMLAPNSTYDAIAGTKPGESCAKRDLPMEIADALAKYDIPLCLYYTGDGPWKDPVQGPIFGFTEPRINVGRDFCEKWAAVLGEYAERYGDKVKAWWMDGFFELHNGYTNELRGLYYDAIKRGNPEALVAFNDRVKPNFVKVYPKEEMTCGEFNDFLLLPPSKYIDGALAHTLAPLGYSFDKSPWLGWCRSGLRHTKEYMASYIRRMNSIGGIATIDVVCDIHGWLDPEQEAALCWIGANV